jgi:DNA-directed RNA polymerase subunit RPC12/RpoP
MALNVSCPTCGYRLAIPDTFAGELFRCKQCGAPFRVAAPADVPAPPVQHVPARPLLPAPAEGGDSRTVRFNCPRCNAGFETPAAQAGTKFFCTGCGQKVQVPDPPQNKTMLGSVAPPSAFPPPGHLPGQAIPYAQYDPPGAAAAGAPGSPVDQRPPRRRRRFRRYYDDDGYDPPTGGAGIAFGITSMVLGIVSLPFAIFPCLGYFLLPVAGLGVVFGIIGLAVGASDRGSQPGFSVAGLVTSGIAIALTVIWLVALPDYWGRRWWWRW